jgi:hypothetical protein
MLLSEAVPGTIFGFISCEIFLSGSFPDVAFCPPYYHFLCSFLGKGSTEKKWKSRQQRLFHFSMLFYSYLKIYWFCLPASVPLMALHSHLFFLCFCLPSIPFPPPPASLFPVLFPPLICYSYWSRSRIHERIISLRFLDITCRVLRLEFSVWIS